MKKEELPKIIPVFPLSNFIIFPRTTVPLNIFEPKYLKMIEDVLATEHRFIGMIQPKSNKKNDAETTLRLNNVGCVGRLISFTETEDSRYFITLSGISRFD